MLMSPQYIADVAGTKRDLKSLFTVGICAGIATLGTVGTGGMMDLPAARGRPFP
jgi:hypothetical protein